MAKFKNDKGLTLIELLITISVLAVVSAIALPVINNVVSASNSNALQQTIKDANDFINKYSKSGVVAYDGLTKTFQGYVDTDGDNQVDANEKIDTLTLDANKFAATVTGTSPALGGSYSNGGVTGVTITAANGGSTAPAAFTYNSVALGYWGGGQPAYSAGPFNGPEYPNGGYYGNQAWSALTPVLMVQVSSATAPYNDGQYGYYTVADAKAMLAVNTSIVTYDAQGAATWDNDRVIAFYHANSDPTLGAFSVNNLN
jgi:prepilin-type N-terminal cleavage/methylation domain-containing protein